MNLHFIFLLINMIGWMAIAVMLCNCSFITKSIKLNIDKTAKSKIIIFSLGVGFLSVLINGLPNIGFSFISFMFIVFVSVILLFYQTKKNKREFLPKNIKRNKEIGNLRYV